MSFSRSSSKFLLILALACCAVTSVASVEAAAASSNPENLCHVPGCQCKANQDDLIDVTCKCDGKQVIEIVHYALQ